MNIVLAAAMGLWAVSLATVASADTLVMRDGSRIEGTVLSIAGRTITFTHADGRSRQYLISRVQSLEFFSADHDSPRAASARRLETPADRNSVTSFALMRRGHAHASIRPAGGNDGGLDTDLATQPRVGLSPR